MTFNRRPGPRNNRGRIAIATGAGGPAPSSTGFIVVDGSGFIQTDGSGFIEVT